MDSGSLLARVPWNGHINRAHPNQTDDYLGPQPIPTLHCYLLTLASEHGHCDISSKKVLVDGPSADSLLGVWWKLLGCPPPPPHVQKAFQSQSQPQHCTPPSDCFSLAFSAPPHGTLVVCSDGFYHSTTGRGSHAWVFSTLSSSTLWKGSGPAWRHPKVMTA
jgi:hypothetical protein